MYKQLVTILILSLLPAVYAVDVFAQTYSRYRNYNYTARNAVPGKITNKKAVSKSYTNTNYMRKSLKKQNVKANVSENDSKIEQQIKKDYVDSNAFSGIGASSTRPGGKKTRADAVAERFLLHMRQGRINPKTSTADTIRMGAELLSSYMYPP